MSRARTLLAFGALALLAACAATQSPVTVDSAAPGFLLGLWHGFIFPVAWLVSLFADKVAVYAVPTTAAGTTSAISSASSCSASAPASPTSSTATASSTSARGGSTDGQRSHLFRHPSAGWGPSEYSPRVFAARDPSFRWDDVLKE